MSAPTPAPGESLVRVICPHCGTPFHVVIDWAVGRGQVDCVKCDRQRKKAGRS